MKRIVICADGTWNEAEKVDENSGRPQPTNVLKTARAVRPRSKKDGVEQVVYYHEGVGTGGGFDRITGGAFGTGITDNIRALYRFLVYNYVEGDEIFLFGFSRGAFTVRTLVGFMNEVGLVQKEDEYYTRELYGLYEENIAPDSIEWKRAYRNIGERRGCPRVKFIGVWDTVGALGGVISGSDHAYHNVEINSNIENAYHALAIDEKRKPFAPSLWTKPPAWTGELVQAWFPGVHSNVGGGYSPDGLANEALHWIIEQAERHQLDFTASYLKHYLPCFNSKMFNTLRGVYRLSGPKQRVIPDDPKFCSVLHAAVIDRMKLKSLNYQPKNVSKTLEKRLGPAAKTRRIPRGKPCPPIAMSKRIIRNEGGDTDGTYIA